eukprot:COSAG02_NODE_33_length_50286_cov_83.550760_17_plen_192_part_00
MYRPIPQGSGHRTIPFFRSRNPGKYPVLLAKTQSLSLGETISSRTCLLMPTVYMFVTRAPATPAKKRVPSAMFFHHRRAGSSNDWGGSDGAAAAPRLAGGRGASCAPSTGSANGCACCPTRSSRRRCWAATSEMELMWWSASGWSVPGRGRRPGIWAQRGNTWRWRGLRIGTIWAGRSTPSRSSRWRPRCV